MRQNIMQCLVMSEQKMCETTNKTKKLIVQRQHNNKVVYMLQVL